MPYLQEDEVFYPLINSCSVKAAILKLYVLNLESKLYPDVIIL